MKTQALGWLAMAVVAAGMNASYHEGGLQWAHQIIDQVGYRTSAVIALATGHAERFAAEVELARAQGEGSSCPFETALTRAENRITRSEGHLDRLHDRWNGRFTDRVRAVMSAREAEQQARVEEQAARIEAQRDRIAAQIAKMRVPAMAVVAPKIDVCPRIRVNVPRIPAIRLPEIPRIQLDVPGADTI
jgi:hypothetical protein